ncbi:Purple acid phosphatase [Zostera marina]|uniref:Purple acid phosphatase n=1 Tax=Zostera marina TaxID=29655 RepID=A0A0K9PZI5_ZOSMR|nr:Purple acid phosphatase [Zostera marina]
MDSNLILPAVVVTLILIPTAAVAVVSFSVSPKTLPRSGASVKIQWSGLSSPTNLDWVGIYSPPSSPDNEFIGYLFLANSTSSPPYLTTGSGTFNIPLTNLRSPYQFRIFRWSESEINWKKRDHDENPLPGTKTRVAVSEEVGFVRMMGPEQVHLALTERENEMRVMWITGNKDECFVEYGRRKEGKLEERIKAVLARYEISHMCDKPANTSIGWRDPGWVHDAVMTGLKRGTRYYYRVGSDALGWSPTYSFISRDNELSQTVAFLFGDMGVFAPYQTFRRLQKESKSTVKWILRDIKELEDKPSLVSHIGDISYARGYSWVWDEFFNQIEPIAAQVPYHVSIGNHEYDWPTQPWRPSWSYSSYGKDGGGECGVPYSVKFRMPGNISLPTGTGSPDTRNLYYSIDVGVTHFLYISTETDFLIGSSQYNFIKHDLKSVDRQKTPYVVVQGHRPMYTTSNEVSDAALRNRLIENVEPLLVENSVTLGLWGHVHRYESFCPLNNYTCIGNVSHSNLEKATVHVVIGMAGQDWQPIWEPRPGHKSPVFPQPVRSMYRGGEFGYTRLVATREKLTLSYIGNHDGSVHDIVEILSGQDSSGYGPVLETPIFSSDKNLNSRIQAESPWYILKYIGVMIIGGLGGYVLGFIMLRWKPDGIAPKVNWTRIRMEET